MIIKGDKAKKKKCKKQELSARVARDVAKTYNNCTTLNQHKQTYINVPRQMGKEKKLSIELEQNI